MGKKNVVGKTVGSLGDYLREQRTAAQLSLRQLADLAGVSNPYLSQIERGLRRPSAEVLQSIAKALRISADQLYVRAGIVSPQPGAGGSVELAVLNDPGLTERQKQSLLDVYASFLAMNAVSASSTTGNSSSTTGDSSSTTGEDSSTTENSSSTTAAEGSTTEDSATTEGDSPTDDSSTTATEKE